MDLSELISKLPVAEQEKLLEQVGQYRDAVAREKAQSKFMSFVKEMWPGFIHGRHHAIMAKKFEEIAEGKLLEMDLVLVVQVVQVVQHPEFQPFESEFVSLCPQRVLLLLIFLCQDQQEVCHQIFYILFHK